MAQKNKLDFTEAIKKLERAKSTLPQQLGNQAVKFFVANFNKESWEGHKWKEVQRRLSKSAGTSSDRTRGILKGKTRHLYLALKNSLRVANWKQIVLGIDVPYAQIQNEGGVTSRGGKIDARPYIGPNKELQERQEKLIHKEILSCFK